jgi:hypothetical protein
MRSHHKEEQLANLVGFSLPLFLEYYNKNIPASFPKASVKALVKFKATYPGLFRENAEWTIDKHRKRLMDWMPSYREA